MLEELQLQVGVKVLLKNPQGKFLLLHRSSVKYPAVKEPWDIVGGRIQPGTSLLENLAREVPEETGLVMTAEPKLTVAQDILRIHGKHVVRLTYVGEIEGEPKIDKEESDQYQWFSMDELQELEGLDSYFKEVLEKNLWRL